MMNKYLQLILLYNFFVPSSIMKRDAKQKVTKKTDSQEYYYESLAGKLLGSKAREALILKEIKKIKKTDSFLEVGCAQGYYLSHALKKTKKVFGIDVVDSFIHVAKKTGASVTVASATKLPQKSSSMDVVLCTETLEHVKHWEDAISEIKRVLKPYGRAIITIPLENSYFWKVFSLIYEPEKYRGHVSLLKSYQIEDEFKSFKLKKKQFIQTPSRSLNNVLPGKEKISMYCFFVFEKK